MIDADSFLAENSLVEVYTLMKKGQTVGGGFNVKVVTGNKLVSAAASVFVMAGISGAMFFFDRDSALAMRGFDENRLVAEDSKFSMDLKAYGKANGDRKFTYLRHVIVGTLDRKDTDVRTTVRWVSQAILAFLGRKQKVKDLDFWYNPKR